MTDKPTSKPEPNEADRERAIRFLEKKCPDPGKAYTGGLPLPAYYCYGCLAAELAAVREEERSLGPCGKHPKACWVVDVGVKGRFQSRPYREYCTVCESEKLLEGK